MAVAVTEPTGSQDHFESLHAMLERWIDLKALVIGDAMLDVYHCGTSNRLCPDVPVPVVDIEATRLRPGGAANVAANLSALGARVRLFGCCGEDDHGAALLDMVRNAGVEVSGLTAVRARSSLTKQRVVARGATLVRFDSGTTTSHKHSVDELFLLRESLREADVVVISDYGYGYVSPALIQELTAERRAKSCPWIIDAKRLAKFRSLSPTLVTPNFTEAASLLPGGSDDRDRARFLIDISEELLQLTGAEMIAVTLDDDGSVLLRQGEPPYRGFATPLRIASTSGAGDTFVAAAALSLAGGLDGARAADLASAAAAVAVGKEHTGVCRRTDLLAFLDRANKYLRGPDGIRRLGLLRESGKRIVFTNGCFDIIHSGHVTYLNQARALGDVLVVGVNSDVSIRKLKGASRPINSLQERIDVLSGLGCVDYIVSFDEETPIQIIDRVRPNVFAKGGDYRAELLPEAPLLQTLGCEIRILPYVSGASTTEILRRARLSPRRPSEALISEPGAR